MSKLEEFFAASRQLGSDRNIVQGAGGNTSYKLGNELIVKASGTRLDNAEEATFARVNLDCCRDLVGSPADMDLADCMTDTARNIRPSIETTLHAVIPHKCIAHVHSVNTIAVSIQPDLDEAMGVVLEGMAWARLPYLKPGLDIATHIADIIDHSKLDILVLENHGLITGAETPQQMVDLVFDVERKLSALIRPPVPKPAKPEILLELCARSPGFIPANLGNSQAMAMDEIAVKAAGAGTLYPDHVVFLGPGVAIVQAGQTIQEAVDQAGSILGVTVNTAIAPGYGVAIRENLSRSANEMLACLAEITLRLHTGNNVRTLQDSAVRQLVDWEAEKYRVGLSND
jgi:rhamnose utilization protein RhaD (predicted bifunctional aldolase and dehydrogenase)